jgi:putative DNA primase/helicase
VTRHKHPLDGLSEAETRDALTAAGWPVWGTSGVHVALGAGLCAVAIEPEGRAAIAKLSSANTADDKLPPGPVVGGGSARLHLFRHRGNLPTAVRLHGNVEGVHVWGAGRRAVLPPTNEGNFTLRWAHLPKGVAFKDIPELPAWLDAAARDSNGGRRAWDAALAPAPASSPCTDYGNAERLVRAHGHDLRWCEAWGAWLVWDGTRWARDDCGEVVRRAKDTVRQIGMEATRVSHEETRKALLKHALDSEKAPRINAMIDLARSERGIPIRPEQMDVDPWLFNCANGTIDLHNGSLQPHRREDLCTKLAPVIFDPHATCPTFDMFFEAVQPDPNVRACLLRVIGYSLTGTIRDHILPIHHGKGGNGKGTFRDAVLDCMGDYAREVQSDLLMSSDQNQHPTGKMVLRGARFASASETRKDHAIDEALVKLLTGGDPITARLMGKDFVTFMVTHKLWLSTNHKPVIRDLTAAMWRRILLFSWAVSIEGDKVDTDLRTKLRAELSGIFNRLLTGCLQWQGMGIAPPTTVQADTATYRTESDPLGEWMACRCTTKVLPGKDVARGFAKELLTDYAEWAKVNGAEAMTVKEFGLAMVERFKRVKYGGIMSYVGIRLMESHERALAAKDVGEFGDGREGVPPSETLADSHGARPGKLSPPSPSSPREAGMDLPWSPPIEDPRPEVEF